MRILSEFLKNEVYKKELDKLNEIFKNVEESKRILVEGLIEETAYIKSELSEMREILSKTGMLKVHPSKPELQKQLPIANEYRRTANIYSLNLKALNSILSKNSVEEDDAFDKWVKEKTKGN